MYHLAAFAGALGVGTDLDMPAAVDDILTIQNTHFVLNQPMDLVYATGFSPLLDRFKLASPTMRQLAAPYVRPIFTGLTGVTNYNAWLLDSNPFRIPAYEEIQCIATSTIGAMTERFQAFIKLSFGFEAIPPGNWTPLRFTSTTAAVANAWTSIIPVFADIIPAGIYAMCLSEVFSTNAQAHRWIVSNQIPRPGFLSFVNSQSRHPYALAKGQLGKMGQFRSNDLPRLQVMCNGADAVHTGYLHVLKLMSL